MEGQKSRHIHVSAYPCDEAVDPWKIANMQLKALQLIDEAKRRLSRNDPAGSDECLRQAQALAAEAIAMQEAEKRRRML